ncbi:MAG: HDOD domain-containing protein [Planctomycetota bacterium]|nr:HDOD domain-containing protein [Planctomycetota bacterium]
MRKKTPRRIDLEDVKSKVGDLPSLPEAVTHVLRIMDDPSSNATDVTNIVVRDAGTAAKVLRLVNSAYFGLASKVSDIKHAVTLLGFKELRTLLLAAGSFGLLSKLGGEQKGFQEIWKHSATVAMLARRIVARRLELDQETAFATGLFHDAGKLALFGYMPIMYRKIVAEAKKQSISFFEAEKLCMDTNHAEIGQWMAGAWRLSPSVVAAIGLHHDAVNAPNEPYALVCEFANYICWLKGINGPGNFGQRTLDLALWKNFGLASDDLDALAAIADIESEFAEIIAQGG